MNTKVKLQTILIVFMVCVTVIMSTNGYANAQLGGGTNLFENAAPENNVITVDPIEGGPGFIMVSPFNFRPYRSTDEWNYISTDLYNPSTINDSTLVAGLMLPHGATITKVTLYFYDNVSSDMTVFLSRDGSATWPDYLAMFTSEGAQGVNRTVSQTNIVYPKVDNQNFSYFIGLSLPHSNSYDLRLMNVRIDYAYINDLPVVLK